MYANRPLWLLEHKQMKKFDYVKWKSLRGDGADNIKGIKGIGDKRATQLIENAEKLEEYA